MVSQPYEGTAVLAPVSSVAEAIAAVRAGARLVDAGGDQALIAAIRREGVTVLDAELILVEPGDVAAAAAAGTPPVVDVDGWGTPAAAGAVAALCAWQGAAMIRTRHVTEVRRCLDMTESILGIRPPARAVRGLA